jgi:hypothetical protein
MFDYRVSKHPHFDEACRAFAAASQHGEAGRTCRNERQTLRNKLNPDSRISSRTGNLLTDLTEDSTLVDGFLAQIHCLPCVPMNEVAKENRITS